MRHWTQFCIICVVLNECSKSVVCQFTQYLKNENAKLMSESVADIFLYTRLMSFALSITAFGVPSNLNAADLSSPSYSCLQYPSLSQ